MESGDLFDIRAITALLKENENGSDGENDAENEERSRLHPGTIGLATPSASTNDKATESTEEEPSRQKATNDSIWSAVEIGSAGSGFKIPDFSSDPRKRPGAHVQFKQDITTEDVYLGSFSATPGSSSCDWLILKIDMAGERDSSKFQLDIKDNWIELRSPLYALAYVLPHQVNPRLGNAKWNPDNSTLILTLKIVRELDAFNKAVF